VASDDNLHKLSSFSSKWPFVLEFADVTGAKAQAGSQRRNVGRRMHARAGANLISRGKTFESKKAKHAGGRGGMGPWAFGVPLILSSTLGLFLNGYVLLVVLGLGKQVTSSRYSQMFARSRFYRVYIFHFYVRGSLGGPRCESSAQFSVARYFVARKRGEKRTEREKRQRVLGVRSHVGNDRSGRTRASFALAKLELTWYFLAFRSKALRDIKRYAKSVWELQSGKSEEKKEINSSLGEDEYTHVGVTFDGERLFILERATCRRHKETDHPRLLYSERLHSPRLLLFRAASSADNPKNARGPRRRSRNRVRCREGSL